MEENLSKQLENLKKSVETKNSVKFSAELLAKRPQTRHLKPFPKGVSGHPEGHPKGQRNYKTIRTEAIIAIGKKNGKTPDEIESMLLTKGISEALKGDFRFYKDDLDRVHGQSVSRSEIGGLEDGNPLKLELSIQKLLDKTYGDTN